MFECVGILYVYIAGSASEPRGQQCSRIRMARESCGEV